MPGPRTTGATVARQQPRPVECSARRRNASFAVRGPSWRSHESARACAVVTGRPIVRSIRLMALAVAGRHAGARVRPRRQQRRARWQRRRGLDDQRHVPLGRRRRDRLPDRPRDFKAKSGITANYVAQRTDYATVLRTSIAGGNPPDVAIMPGIGFVRSFAQGRLDQGLLGDLGIDTQQVGRQLRPRHPRESARSTASSTA